MTQSPRINIHAKDEFVKLAPGKYQVYIIGGWLISENDFQIRLKGKRLENEVKISKAKIATQTIEYGKRAKRCYDFEILELDDYSIDFANPDSLIVKRNNLPIFNLLFSASKPVPNETLAITIVKE